MYVLDCVFRGTLIMIIGFKGGNVFVIMDKFYYRTNIMGIGKYLF